VAYRTASSKIEIDLVEDLWAAQSRDSFWAFRQYMHPKLIRSWWVRDAARRLQKFGDDLNAGLRPKLLITAPPQHGKSMMITDFLAWYWASSPDTRIFYASFSERLGVRANLTLQRIFDNSRFQRAFPDFKIPSRVTMDKDNAGRRRNASTIETLTSDGVFRNTTVRGAITGEGLDLGVLDDPIKGREEAQSIRVRDRTWEWLTDDFMTRFSDDGGLLGIMTRWHVDDPFGRIVDAMPDVEQVRYPALAEHDEVHRKAGEPLFPEHKSLGFLLERKAAMTAANFEALYQQNPVIAGGNIFQEDWWQFRRAIPELEYLTVYGDTAQKKDQRHDYSVFQLWGKMKNGGCILIDQARGRWSAPELRREATAFWDKHKARNYRAPIRAFKVEDKSSGTGLIQELRERPYSLPIIGIPRNRDKVSRAQDVSPHIEAGHVYILDRQPWLADFLAEAAAFPDAPHDDQIDPMMDAVGEMLGIAGAGGAEIRIRSL